MRLNSATVFLRRPLGGKAVQIGVSMPRAEAPIRAVLQAHDGRVLVKSIERQPDGTFIGEVYGVMPHQRSVAVGDVVRFEEDQIFTFKAADDAPKESADADMLDIVRKFEERFKELEAQYDKGSDASPSVDTVDSLCIDGAITGDQHDSKLPNSKPGAELPTPPAPAAPAAPVAAVEAPEDMSITEALSILGASEVQGRMQPAQRLEPQLMDQSPPANVGIGGEHILKCLECGTTLILLPSQQALNDGAREIKVSCPNCGRINKLAGSEASRRRLQH